MKNTKDKKEESEEEEEIEEVEEIEEEEEFEDQVGEDFSKDPRAFSYLQDAGRIADEVLQFLLPKMVPGAVLYELCSQADALIREKLSKVYTKSKFIKGVAFPTCISLNEVCGNYSAPLDITDDPHEYKALSEGDVAKIDLGVQIHGFAAVLAHTVVVTAKPDDKVTGAKANAVLAAYHSVHAALRMLKVNASTNNDVTKSTQQICDDYNVKPVEGVLSHRMKRDIIDGIETIINKETIDQKVESRKFEYGDVFGLDVIVSTGEGKPKETGIKTTIYKRALETTYQLRAPASRKLLSVVENNFYSFPFSFNVFDKEENLKLKNPIQNLKTTMKLGLTECVKNELLHPYPVLSEKKGEIVAQFKYTVAVRNDNPIIICGLPIDVTKYETDKKITDDKINEILKSNLDDYLPNFKRTVKLEKKKKDAKAKRAAKKAAKKKRKEEEAKKREEKNQK